MIGRKEPAYLALAVTAFTLFSSRRFEMGVALLAASPAVVVAALHRVIAYAGHTPHPRDVRSPRPRIQCWP